ncbi:ribonuclease HI [Poseidonibacter ostreae]|jgi:ribonuclease HI|uniref:Ribonuclease H n=1 Tax=Poseidonibacter ostreae TaxID=2654171 RepID=A0A6L4WPV5_9BACT|nr:RNase H family protein [Poseidonibacter ostreae]KAB7884438.1 ribonuclease H [Poseidonibacter ostreae]MAC85143.1 ribonuclease H [Arcobacter sp.]|tara:strand:+ start:6550 stop:7044 length:495 start_codon:yes stop_codon:yes gene_type:complete
MEQIILFCDGSVNPQRKIGFGAYFIYNLKLINQNIKIKKFEETSSTKLELEVLLWAFDDLKFEKDEILIYTDCQNILGLEKRREKLELNDYHTSTGKIVKNHELYKKFYKRIDAINENTNCSFKKVKGHKKTKEKDEIDKLFNLVDKASRKALREYLKEENCNE